MKMMNRLTKGKAILAVMLALVLAGGFYISGDKAYAAGSVTGTVTKDSSWPANQSIIFNLYKVGDYGRTSSGDVIYKLDTKYVEAAGVVTQLEDPTNYGKKPDDPTYENWVQEWLDTANSLSTYINSKVGEADKPESAGHDSAVFEEGKDTATFNIPNLDNGLYLMIGSSFEAADMFWTPQPMLVSVLNGERAITYNTNIGVKMISRPIVHEHDILKEFRGDEGLEEYIQPEKIAVRIMYGSTDPESSSEVVATEILDRESEPNFYFSWKDKVHYSSGDDAQDPDDDVIESIDYIVDDEVRNTIHPDKAGTWFVVELKGDEAKQAFIDARIPEAEAEDYAKNLEYYTVQYGEPKTIDDKERLDIINTYTYKKLALTKKIDEYYEDCDDAAFSFLIEGFDGEEQSGNKIYENHLGVVINQKDEPEKTVELKYIPYNVKSIRIIEEYSGNYTNVRLDWEETTPDSSDPDQVIGWEAIAENTHTGHTPGGGVVNQFRHGEDPKQMGPKTEESPR